LSSSAAAAVGPVAVPTVVAAATVRASSLLCLIEGAAAQALHRAVEAVVVLAFLACVACEVAANAARSACDAVAERPAAASAEAAAVEAFAWHAAMKAVAYA
jgi:hypothetical protein